MTHPAVSAHQSKCYNTGLNYELQVAAHLRSLGATVRKANMSSGYDLDVTHADGTTERVECKGGIIRGGVACSARAKEVFAMGALFGPLAVYSSNLPTSGSISDRLMKLGIELGFISTVTLLVS